MTLCDSQGKCVFSGKDITQRNTKDINSNKGTSSKLSVDMNNMFMKSIGAIGFGPSGVKTQTNEIISGNDEIIDKKSFLFNC